MENLKIDQDIINRLWEGQHILLSETTRILFNLSNLSLLVIRFDYHDYNITELEITDCLSKLNKSRFGTKLKDFEANGLLTNK